MKKILLIPVFSLVLCFCVYGAWVDADGSGQESINISQTSLSSTMAVMTTDSGNRPHVTWRDDTNNYNTYYIWWNGSAWVDMDGTGRESIDASVSGNVGSGPNVKIDSAGKPYLSWMQSAGSVGSHVQKWNGSAWVGMDGTVPGIVLSTGAAAGGYVSLSPVNDYPSKVWDGVGYTKWNGSSWSAVSTIASGSGAHIQIDAAGREHVLYLSGGNAYYVWNNGGAWVGANGGTLAADKLVATAITDWSPYLFVESSGQQHVVYEKSGEVYYVKWNGSAWVDADGSGQEAANISNNAGTSAHPRMGVDTSGNPNVAWSDNTDGNYDTYFLKWSGSAWVDADGTGRESVKVIATTGNSSGVWLEVSGDDTIHVTWMDDSEGNNEIFYLKYVPEPAATATATPAATVPPANTATATATVAPAVTDTPEVLPTVTDPGDTVVYPTVAKDHVKIVFNVNKKCDVKVYVYTFKGTLVEVLDYNIGETPNDKLYKIQLDVSRYEEGVYYYTIQGKTADGGKVNYKSKKFMVKGK